MTVPGYRRVLAVGPSVKCRCREMPYSGSSCAAFMTRSVFATS